MSNSGFSWGAKLSEIADAVWTRTTRTLSNLDDTRAARIDNLDVALSTRATAADVWGYTNRTLTQAKFPFWSAIITQVQGSISLPGQTTVFVNITPPTDETWLVDISAYNDSSDPSTNKEIYYSDYDGTTRRRHNGRYSYDDREKLQLAVTKILTSSLYASIEYNTYYSATGYYGYSGFKLSQPQWSTQKAIEQAELPFKRSVPNNKVLAFPQLAAKAYLRPDNKIAYHLVTEVLAVDPVKNVPVETAEYHILEEDLVANLAEFKTKPQETGWDKIFTKLAQEGITL